MKVGDLVEIGWNGKEKRPFIGVILSLYFSGISPDLLSGYVMVNGQPCWANISRLKKIEDAVR